MIVSDSFGKMKGNKEVSKTVKHCAVCQENFGDRFSFCPVCGEPLKPVGVGQNEALQTADARQPSQLSREETVANTASLANAENVKFTASAKESANGANGHQVNEPQKSVVTAPALKQINNAPRVEQFQPTPNFDNTPSGSHNDGLYHLTILQTPSGYGRNLQIGALTALLFLLTAGVTLFLYDLYNYKLDIDPVDEAFVLSPVFGSDEPPAPEDKPQVIKDNKPKGGGGGGGGNENPKPASKGVDAAQSPDPPLYKPSVTYDRVDKPSIPIQATTQGPIKTTREDGPYGLKNSTNLDPSDGPGHTGGQGTGSGGGQGGGRGTGIGNGNGSGRGNGNGNGIGNGSGNGTGGGEAPPAPKAPPKPAAAAVTTPIQILSKPRANYTEEARKNQVSGTVLLSVTFGANGQINGVSVAKGLPNGLTEQAIAAAKQIKFTPQKKDGVAVAVTKRIEYNFNLY